MLKKALVYPFQVSLGLEAVHNLFAAVLHYLELA